MTSEYHSSSQMLEGQCTKDSLEANIESEAALLSMRFSAGALWPNMFFIEYYKLFFSKLSFLRDCDETVALK